MQNKFELKYSESLKQFKPFFVDLFYIAALVKTIFDRNLIKIDTI